MSKTKLPAAKDWRNRDIEDWNVMTFIEYIKENHYLKFGVTYKPFGGTWGLEQGLIGNLIGTKSKKNPKPRTASNEMVKSFIDQTFGAYQPNKNYPGTSFGFMWTYRSNVWQQIEAQEKAKQKVNESKENSMSNEDLDNWF